MRAAAIALTIALGIDPHIAAAQTIAAPVPRESGSPIAFVPLDDRPVTYQLPVLLGEIAGRPVLTPPLAMLGHYLQPGDTFAIARWLRSDATRDASALVASTDMIAYGGLVASRAPGPSITDAFARLRGLAELKAERKIGFVGVFGTIMRLAPTGVPDIASTAGYYARGETVDRLQAYANLPDPPQAADDVAKARRLRAAIGDATLDAYLASRTRNLQADEWALQLAAEGGFDRIVIGQDDAGPTGLHLKDVAALKATAASFLLHDAASIEPGADELGMVMLAQAFARGANWVPSVAVHYSRPDGGTFNDRLEYVPIDVTIGQIVDACGARRNDRASNADIDLYVRVPGTSDADEETFETSIVTAVGASRSVAVADLTFLEGEPGPKQRALTDGLIANGVAGKIDAFASWNTDANTIGTALPEAIAVGVGKRTHRYDARAHAQFMLDRYADDYAFHQFVRPDLNATLRARDIDTTLLVPEVAREANALNRAELWPYALDLLAKIYPHYRDVGLTITLPWERTFETQLDVRLAPR